MNSERLNWLKAIPLFGGLREDTLEFLVSRTATATVGAGELFCEQGDQGQSMFVLEEGEVSVQLVVESYSHPVNTLGPGDCFGEMCLIECAPRSARVQAVVDCKAFELAFDTLHELYEFDREQFLLVQMNMAREVSRRLRQVGELLTEARTELAARAEFHGLFW